MSLFGHVFLGDAAGEARGRGGGRRRSRARRVAGGPGRAASARADRARRARSIAERIRQATPRAALLSTLAGIALTFIALGFLFRAFARPIVGLTTLGDRAAHVLRARALPGRAARRARRRRGRRGARLGRPASRRWAPRRSAPASACRMPTLGDLAAGPRAAGICSPYLSVILPMGLFNVVGSLQNIESAEAAGDRYPTAPSLAVNGLGSVAAACFGSCFPTTIYIGHPGWKAMGARAGYSVLNGAFATVVCLTGTLAYIAWAVPVDAGMAIVLWIGLVITAQAFQATPRAHAPAVVVGLLPGVAAWGALMAKNGLRAAGMRRARRTAVLAGADRRVPARATRGSTARSRSSRASSSRRRCSPRRRSASSSVASRAPALWCVVGAALSACRPHALAIASRPATPRSRSRPRGSGPPAMRSWPACFRARTRT